MKFAEYDSPCGRLLLGVYGRSVCLCDWITGDRIDKTLKRINKFLPVPDAPDDLTLTDIVKGQLDEYFAGCLKRFDLPLMALGTEFQKHVWNALQRVPYGHTAPYKFIAETVGVPHGVRAVASAVGANPLSILIPCHRIIGKDGSLAGYAGGLEAKRYLLKLESGAPD